MKIYAPHGEAFDVHLPYPIDTDGEPVTGLATGDILITEDDLTGIADSVDADDGDLDAFTLTDGIRFQLSETEMAVPGLLLGTRTIRIQDQPAGTAYITEDHQLITTDSHLAAEPNGCVWASKGHATGQTTTNIVLGADVDSEQPTDAGITIPVGAYFEVTSGTHAGARGYVKSYSSNAITPYEALAAALDNTDMIRVYRDAPAPARITAKESTVGLSTQEDTDAQAAAAAALTAYDAVVPADLPANFADLSITASTGLVSVGTLAAAAIQSIWDALTSALTTAGSIGKLLVDKLNGVSGQVASQSEVTAIQNNTRVVRVVPDVIELATRTYRIELFLYDTQGAMEAPDAAPTIELVDQDGNDLSARLDSATMTLVETGRYRAIYTSDAAHAAEQLLWAFTVVEGGNTRKYGNRSIIVDTIAIDFTAADRAKLDTLHDSRLTAARAANLDEITAARLAELDAANLPADVDGLTTSVGALPTAANIADAVLDEATAGHTTAGTLGKAIADILADTNELQGDWVNGGRLDLLVDDIISKLPAATVDGLTPTQLWATVLASCAGAIVDKTANPMVIQNPDGTQTRISVTPDRGAVTLSFTGV